MNSVFTPQTDLELSNRASRRAGRPGRQARKTALVATSAAVAGSALLASHAGAAPAVRLADSNAFKRGTESGPQVQLLSPGYSATLKGTDVPIVVKIAGRKFAPKTLELFVDGLNASNGAIALDSSPTVELKWDTTLFPDGVHRLTVRVTDVQGFIGQSETQVFINNKGQVDTTAPVLSWLNISDGDRLKGEVSIQLKASDNFGVKYIFVSINPAITPTRKPPLRQYLVNRPPYAFSFDTTKVPDGVYVLDALAWDALENEGKAPTRTFGVLNNGLNPTVLNALEVFGNQSRIASVLPQVAETPDVPEEHSAVPASTGSAVAKPVAPANGSKPGRVFANNNAGTPNLPQQPAAVQKPDFIAEIPRTPVAPSSNYTGPGDDALTIATAERRGAASPGGRMNVVPSVRQTPRMLASAPDATTRGAKTVAPMPVRIAEMAPVQPRQRVTSVVEPGTPSIAASEFSVTSRGTAAAGSTRNPAELRATAPRMARAATAEALPRFPQQNAVPPQVSTATQTVELALATRPTGVANARTEFAPRFTAPAAPARYATSADAPTVKSAQSQGAPAVSIGSTSFGTSPSTVPVALPAREVRSSSTRATLPTSVQKLVRASIDAPRAVSVTAMEAALSLTELPQSTVTSRLGAPRFSISNPLRGGMDLTSFKRATPAEAAAVELVAGPVAPSAVFVSTSVSSSHEAAVPRITRPVSNRVTLPVFPTINETRVAPSQPAASPASRLSMLPKPAESKRDMRNAITIAPAQGAKALPVSYTAPRDTYLSAVAAQYDVALDMLAAVNNLKANAKLARGQEILFPREISVRYAGKPVTGDVASLMVGSTSVTAFRFLFEKNGGTMKWDAAKQRVIANDGQREIILTVGSKVATVNRKDEMMEMAAFLLSGRTMVPVRFFEKSMAARIEWEPATGRLLVSVANPTTVG